LNSALGMFIEEFRLRGFRNFTEARITGLSPGLNLFYGPNGGGKTNLLEALGLASLAKSMRGALDSEMVQFGSKAAVVEIDGQIRKKKVNLKFAISRGGMKRIVGEFGKALRVSDAVGMFAVVFILPDDVNITSGSPKHHRNFLDIYLSQLSHKYLLDLMEYQKVLKQRNALLRKLKNGSENIRHLDSWDANLVGPALRIMAARSLFLEEIKPLIAEISVELLGPSEELRISYRPRMELDDFSDSKGGLAILNRERARDLKLGATFCGPHRDLMDLSFGGKPLRNYGSLGQKKCAMIALKLAAFRTLSRHRGEEAILVLDEAFAALDNNRLEALLCLLSEYGQVFLASAVTSGLERRVKIFDVDSGRVSERDCNHVCGN
jgi:DNA replication and repair protein RecF